MKKLLLKEFALKPRRLRNTFWLWGVLYPYLLSLAFVVFFPKVSFDSYINWGSFVIHSFFVLVLIEVLFALSLTYRVFDSKIKALLTCIVQFVFSATVVLGNYVGLMMILFRTSD
jgi:hypothetical protein